MEEGCCSLMSRGRWGTLTFSPVAGAKDEASGPRVQLLSLSLLFQLPAPRLARAMPRHSASRRPSEYCHLYATVSSSETGSFGGSRWVKLSHRRAFCLGFGSAIETILANDLHYRSGH